jgi:parallel beta-helix repeat protein
MRYSLHALVPLLVLLSAFPLSATDGRIPIASLPYNITAPGHYYLTQNFSIASPVTAVTLTASDVTLDFDGHAITYPASLATPAFAVLIQPGENRILKNAVIRNATRAVDLLVSGTPLKNTVIRSLTVVYGSNPANGAGIGIEVNAGELSNLMVEDYQFSVGSGGAHVPALLVEGSGLVNNAVIRDFNFTDYATATPPAIESTGTVTFSSLEVGPGAMFFNGRPGIVLNYAMQNTAIHDVRMTGTGGNPGIQLTGCNWTAIRNVRLRGTIGIELVNCDQARVEDSEIYGSASGIHLSGTTRSLLLRNNVSGNTAGILLDNSSTINTIESNRIYGGVNGLSITSGTSNAYALNKSNGGAGAYSAVVGNVSAGNNCDFSACNR